MLGPGFVTGSSDDDPSGIATYSQTGAQYGYLQLWTAVWMYPLVGAVQEICGRIGLVTGCGMTTVLRKYYPKSALWLAVVLLCVANTVNAGADLGGMAATLQLLVHGTFLAWMLVVVAVTVTLQVLVPYQRYAVYLKWACLSLLAYAVVAFVVHQDWGQVAWRTFVPWFHWNHDYLLNIVALLGTTITPYCFFWMANQEAEENLRLRRVTRFGHGVPSLDKHDIRDMRTDDAIGMGFMELVQWLIIVACAATLYPAGITDINTPDQAAQALRPLAGDFTYLLFALGIVGIGFAAVPVMTGSAAQALTEALGRRASLSYSFREAPTFYTLIAAGTVIGVVLNYVGVPPFKMLYYSAALNGILAPPLIAMITHVGNNPRVMGEHTNNRFGNVMGWLTAAIMAVCAAALIVSMV